MTSPQAESTSWLIPRGHFRDAMRSTRCCPGTGRQTHRDACHGVSGTGLTAESGRVRLSTLGASSYAGGKRNMECRDE